MKNRSDDLSHHERTLLPRSLNVRVMHVFDMHVFDMHVFDMHVCDMHVCDMHVFDMHAFYRSAYFSSVLLFFFFKFNLHIQNKLFKHTPVMGTQSSYQLDCLFMTVG